MNSLLRLRKRYGYRVRDPSSGSILMTCGIGCATAANPGRCKQSEAERVGGRGDGADARGGRAPVREVKAFDGAHRRDGADPRGRVLVLPSFHGGAVLRDASPRAGGARRGRAPILPLCRACQRGASEPSSMRTSGRAGRVFPPGRTQIPAPGWAPDRASGSVERDERYTWAVQEAWAGSSTRPRQAPGRPASRKTTRSPYLRADDAWRACDARCTAWARLTSIRRTVAGRAGRGFRGSQRPRASGRSFAGSLFVDWRAARGCILPPTRRTPAAASCR